MPRRTLWRSSSVSTNSPLPAQNDARAVGIQSSSGQDQRSRLSKVRKYPQQLLIVGEASLVHLTPTQDAVVIDDKDRTPARSTVLTPHSVFPRDLALWMKISQERKAQTAELRGKSSMGMDAIDADAQHLGVRCLEACNVALQSSDLGLSATGKIENIEGKQHMALAAIILKACLFADRSRE